MYMCCVSGELVQRAPCLPGDKGDTVPYSQTGVNTSSGANTSGNHSISGHQARSNTRYTTLHSVHKQNI